jgi:hypothetical protein
MILVGIDNGGSVGAGAVDGLMCSLLYRVLYARIEKQSI